MNEHKRKSELLVEIEQLRVQVELFQQAERQRRRVEEAHALADACTRGLVETSLDALVALDPDCRITEVNTAAETLTGYERHELIGSDAAKYVGDPSQVEEGRQRLLDGELLRRYRVDLRHKQGRLVPVLCNASVLRDRAGELRGWVAAARDIADLQNAEEHLREDEVRFNQDIALRRNLELEHARTEARLKQLTQQLITVQEAERRRIAQDLHDDIGQAMTALILRLNAILTGLSSDQQEAKSELEAAIESVEMLMSEIRQLAYQLLPSALDSMPLSRALASLCASFIQKSGLTVQYSCDEDLPPIPNVQGTALYRLAQEGLNNAVKHARASSIWINLDYADGEVGLSIEDNGKGFDLKGMQMGMGLQGLHERFSMLNGGLEIDSSPGKGTRLYGSLPLADHSL